MIRLEDMLTDKEILSLGELPIVQFARACIALAVSKCEKVEGCVGIAIDQRREGGFYFNVGPPVNPAYRHALLLLGPKYEPKPVKSAEERIAEAVARHEQDYGKDHACSSRTYTACNGIRILRGEEGR